MEAVSLLATYLRLEILWHTVLRTCLRSVRIADFFSSHPYGLYSNTGIQVLNLN